EQRRLLRGPHVTAAALRKALRNALPESRRAEQTGHSAPHLTPVPLHRWHFTVLSPFFTSPLPSQFLHFGRFLMLGPLRLSMAISACWFVTLAHFPPKLTHTPLM